MAMIGYARVSGDDQNLDLQLDALNKAQCEQIFIDDAVCAVSRIRPQFDAAMAALRRGDTFVIWKMDRAYRSVLQAAAALEEFKLYDMRLLCLTEPIDLGTALGRCTYHVRNAYAELERELIIERTIAGMQAARRRGKHLGRPRKLSDIQIAAIHRRLQTNPRISQADLARAYNVSQRTICRLLSHPRQTQPQTQGAAYA